MKTKQTVKRKRRSSASQELNGREVPGLPVGSSVSVEFVARWKERYAELRKRDHDLRLELARLQAERDAHLNSLQALLPVYEADFDEESALAQAGKGKSMKDLIEELLQDAPTGIQTKKKANWRT